MRLNDLREKNNILRGLPPSERELIVPFCEIIYLNLGDNIEEAGRPIQFLHFPIDSAISLTNFQDQAHLVEVTVTGKEGSSGASIVLGDNRSPCMAMVQIHGTAVRLAASKVMDSLSSLPYLHDALNRYNLMLMKHAVISVGCSQFHSPAQRLARWLKAHWQRTGIVTFPFSDEFLALQVGIDAATVKERLIELGHNRVVISDQEGLERQTCPCYFLAKQSVDEYTDALKGLSRSHSHSSPS